MISHALVAGAVSADEVSAGPTPSAPADVEVELEVEAEVGVEMGAGGMEEREDEASVDPEPTNATAGEETPDEIVITGFRTGLLRDDPSAFATTIDLDEYQGEHRSLEDVLSQVVGVQIRRFGGPGERSEISIRGFAPSQVVVTLDGVRLNSVRGSGVDLSNIPVELLQSVEVLRGGGAIGEGSGAMGGVLRLETRRPGQATEARVTAGGASFKTANVSLFAGSPSEIVDWGLGYNFFRTDGDYEFQRPLFVFVDEGNVPLPLDPPSATRINNESEKHSLTLSLGRELGNWGYLFANQNLLFTSRGEPGLDRAVSGSNAGQQAFAHSREFGSISQLRWEEIDLGLADIESRVSLSYRFKRNRFKDPAPAANPAQPIDVSYDDSTGDLTWTAHWEGEGLGAQHTITGEFETFRDALDASDRASRDRWDVALSLRDRLGFLEDKLQVIPALRFDWNEDFGDNWLPSLGLVIHPLPWLRIKSNADRAFRIPSFEELYLPDQGFISGNPNLEPEESWNVDAGFEILIAEAFPFRDIRFEAVYFYSAIENSIIWVYRSPTRIGPVNSGDATSQGVELGLSLGITSYVTLSANHTELDATSDETGNRLPGRPERETNARIEVADRGVWKLVGELQRTGSITVSRDDSFTMPARSVWNMSAALNFAEVIRPMASALRLSRLWLSFRVDNIGDVSVRDARSFPQPGRSFGLTLEAGW